MRKNPGAISLVQCHAFSGDVLVAVFESVEHSPNRGRVILPELLLHFGMHFFLCSVRDQLCKGQRLFKGLNYVPEILRCNGLGRFCRQNRIGLIKLCIREDKGVHIRRSASLH